MERSGVAADIVWDAVPKHPSLAVLPHERQLEAAMNGGDDYELVFTAPSDKRGLVEQASISSLTPVTRIGRIIELTGPQARLTMHDRTGQEVFMPAGGFDHFE